MSGDSAPLVLCGFAALYFIAHFVAFCALFRHQGRLGTERRIFLYHLVPAAALLIAAAAMAHAFSGEKMLAAALGVVFAQGIYSLTFLELWSLSQISYSRNVLITTAEVPGITREQTIARLSAIGDEKKSLRLESLARLRLVRRGTGEWQLTPLGRALALALKGMLWLPNSGPHG